MPITRMTITSEPSKRMRTLDPKWTALSTHLKTRKHARAAKAPARSASLGTFEGTSVSRGPSSELRRCEELRVDVWWLPVLYNRGALSRDALLDLGWALRARRLAPKTRKCRRHETYLVSPCRNWLRAACAALPFCSQHILNAQ